MELVLTLGVYPWALDSCGSEGSGTWILTPSWWLLLSSVFSLAFSVSSVVLLGIQYTRSRPWVARLHRLWFLGYYILSLVWILYWFCLDRDGRRIVCPRGLPWGSTWASRGGLWGF